MKKVEKPWGHEIIWAKTENYVAKFLHINSNSRLSLQYHEKKEETIYVIEGPLRLQIGHDGDEEVKESGSIVHISPGLIHRFGAGKDSVILCEVSTPELSDVVRLEDDYSR
tara:strand:- start:64 stop:396 length:333 start_codon:yes stop_codon:yes gene_type:complete